MRFIDRASVRTKIAALLAVLVALWGFAAWVTVRESLNLLVINYVEESGRATEEVVGAVQRERRLSAVVLGGGDRSAELETARARTDELAATWRALVDRRSQRLAASDRLEVRYDDFGAQLTELAGIRDQVDTAALTRAEAVTSYTVVVDAGFAIYGSMSSLDDQEVARQSGTLVRLSQARELISQQDALLAGGLAAGELTEPEIVTFTQLVGAQRRHYDRTSADLLAEDYALYQAAAGGPAMAELRRLEDTVVAQARAGAPPPVSATEWDAATSAATDTMREMELAAVDNVVGRAMPVVVGIILRLLVAGGLGLAAVILSVTVGRTLIRRLEELRDSADDLASNRLPRVVRRLSAGETVDVTAEAPPVREAGGGEVGQLAHAFNTVQQAAVGAAVGQAELRRGVRDVFLSLARRTQGLLHRQLRTLDEAERREADPDKMAELFRIDHLATRMRRNAENLIVLAGASSGRSWRHPVAMIDVVRGAISEVEEYTRVQVSAMDEGAVGGRVAGDVIHLLAELVENATSYSPPYAQVTVSGQRVARGFAIEIEDRGLGMSEADLAAVNQKLARPPDFDLADASHLGHYVVAKLAQRHDIRVALRPSPYGGISAVVLIPQAVIVDETEALPAPEARMIEGEPGAEPAAAPQWRGSAAVPPENRSRAAGAPPSPRPAGAAAAGTGAGPSAENHQPDTTAPPTGHTPAGLPWRVRQASLPRQLRHGPADPSSGPEAGGPDTAADAATGTPAGAHTGGGNGDNGDHRAGRDPDEVHRMMSAYQRGTRLGRGEAAGTDPASGRGGRTDHSQESQEG